MDQAMILVARMYSCSYTDVQYIVFNKNINFNISAVAGKIFKKNYK